MKYIILWLQTHPWTVYSTLLSLILYCLKTLPKKLIIHTARADSVETMQGLRSKEEVK